MGSASTKSKNKYNAANYERISLFVPKEQKGKIKAHATDMGESINSFVNRAIGEAMQRDTTPLKNEQIAPPSSKKLVNADLETERARKAILDKLHEL